MKCEVNLLVKFGLEFSIDSIKVIHRLAYIHSLGFQYDFLRVNTDKRYISCTYIEDCS